MSSFVPIIRTIGFDIPSNKPTTEQRNSYQSDNKISTLIPNQEILQNIEFSSKEISAKQTEENDFSVNETKSVTNSEQNQVEQTTNDQEKDDDDNGDQRKR